MAKPWIVRLALAGAVTVLVVAVVAGIRDAAATDESTSYEEEIDQWIKARDARLRSPDYYLSIVGLYWLEDGANTFGSDPSNDVVFPKGAPAAIGSFNVREGVVTVEVVPGIDVTYDGEPVKSMRLLDDSDENGPTTLVMGTMNWFVIKRGDRLLIRLKDSKSEGLRKFKGVDRFAVDPKWRLEARLETYSSPRFVEIENTIQIATNERVYGTLFFDVDGETYSLDALVEAGTEALFVIFADATSGEETYGGGRFVYVDVPADGESAILDFNKAYNPPCAFNDYTTCPLPPPQNQLPIPVTAGEKTYKR